MHAVGKQITVGDVKLFHIHAASCLSRDYGTSDERERVDCSKM